MPGNYHDLKEAAADGFGPEGDADLERLTETIRLIWVRLLARPQLSADDDLLQQGMDSLCAIRGLAALRRDVGPLTLEQLLKLRTVRQLAIALADTPATQSRMPTGAAVHPLTTQQRAMISAAGPVDAFYAAADVVRISGPLDEGRMRSALMALPARHEVLRMQLTEDLATARTLPPDSPTVVASVRETGADPVSPQTLRARLTEPFDLRREVPFRAQVARCGDGDWLLGIATHHLASDGWSHRILLEDAIAAYQSDAENLAPAVSYWVAHEHNAEHFDRTIWTDLLQRKHLAIRALRPKTPTSHTAQVQVLVADSTAASVRACAARSGSTPYQLFATALLRSLGDVLKDPEVIIGTPFSGRVHPNALTAVGYFSNTILVGADLREHASDESLLAEVGRLVRLGQTKLTRDWREAAGTAASEIFTIRAVVDGDEEVIGLPSIDGLILERVEEDPATTANRPVTVTLKLNEGEVVLSVEYRPDTIPLATAEALCSALSTRFADLMDSLS